MVPAAENHDVFSHSRSRAHEILRREMPLLGAGVGIEGIEIPVGASHVNRAVDNRGGRREKIEVYGFRRIVFDTLHAAAVSIEFPGDPSCSLMDLVEKAVIGEHVQILAIERRTAHNPTTSLEFPSQDTAICLQ